MNIRQPADLREWQTGIDAGDGTLHVADQGIGPGARASNDERLRRGLHRQDGVRSAIGGLVRRAVAKTYRLHARNGRDGIDDLMDRLQSFRGILQGGGDIGELNFFRLGESWLNLRKSPECS